MKNINTRIVLKELQASRVATVKELAAATELTVATVTGILQDLLERGRAVEGELIPSLGGRPSRQYVFNETRSLALVVFTREIGGRDSVCLRVLDLYGQLRASQDQPMDEITMDSLESLIAQSIDQFPTIGAISIGLPGIELGGTIVALDYRSLIGEPIVSRLSDRFSIPVMVENDVNAAVLGWCERKAVATEGTVVYVYFPRKYGPGAGISIGGKLLKGRTNAAGEIARLPLGISWGAELTDDFDRFTKAAANTLLGISAVLDPDTFVLYGEFLTDRHLAALRTALWAAPANGACIPVREFGITASDSGAPAPTTAPGSTSSTAAPGSPSAQTAESAVTGASGAAAASLYAGPADLILADDFSADFEQGLSSLALKTLLDNK